MVAIEPAAAPSLTRGVYAYDFGDTSMMTPLVKMYTLGHGFMPAPIHAGGLRYHGMASSICELYRNKLIEARAVQQLATFEAGVHFARPRASSRRRRRRTPSGARSTRRSGAARRGRPRRSPSTCAATATSTWRPTSGTSPGSSTTTSCPRPTSTGRWPSCRESDRSSRGAPARSCPGAGAVRSFGVGTGVRCSDGNVPSPRRGPALSGNGVRRDCGFLGPVPSKSLGMTSPPAHRKAPGKARRVALQPVGHPSGPR